MTVKEFIKSDLHLNQTELAKLMFPSNKTGSKNYLSAKLNGTRNWTDKDTEKAKEALKKIYSDRLAQIESLT